MNFHFIRYLWNSCVLYPLTKGSGTQLYTLESFNGYISLQVTPSPSTALIGTPSPGNLLGAGSPGNPQLHVPSPGSFVPAPSPQSLGIHMQSPAGGFMGPSGRCCTLYNYRLLNSVYSWPWRLCQVLVEWGLWPRSTNTWQGLHGHDKTELKSLLLLY